MSKTVSIEIIKKCPNLCLHCSSSSTLESTEEMLFSLIESVVDKLSMMDVTSISLSGGEPFLHPDLPQIVEHIASCGIDINIYSCGIMETNGKFKEIDVPTLIGLRDMGLDRIMFNLQACNASTYNAICGNNDYFPYVLQSIRNAVKSKIPTEIHFVPMKLNYHEIAKILNFAEKENLEKVSFLKLVPHGRALENLDKIVLNKTEDLNVRKTLLRAQEQGAKIRIGVPYSESNRDNCLLCHAVKNKLYIRYDGCVFGCEAFKYINFSSDEGNILPSNIYETDIKTIYETSSHLRMSEKLIEFYSTISCEGENCPVQKYLREQEMKGCTLLQTKR